MTLGKILRIVVLLMAVIVPGYALRAAPAWIWGASVQQTMLDSQYYGLCMARITPGPESVHPTCSSGWVTFSCTGDFNSKNDGNLKYQTTQLSILSGKKLHILVDDTKRHNGYCFAPRVDLLN